MSGNFDRTLSREDVLRFWRIKREADGRLLARDWEAAAGLPAGPHTLRPRAAGPPPDRCSRAQEVAEDA